MGNTENIIQKRRIINASSKIVWTFHADESGYFATFIDSEGNRIGLHSPNYSDKNNEPLT